MSGIIDKLELPKEVTLQEAADVLGVSVRTVRRYIEDGLLAARNLAPLRSTQAMYRIRLADVVELRTNYGVQQKSKREPVPRRRGVKQYEPKTMRRK